MATLWEVHTINFANGGEHNFPAALPVTLRECDVHEKTLDEIAEKYGGAKDWTSIVMVVCRGK